ncbi:MAG: hypothetical protein AB9869_37600 [Verrucomicrobiia bacterium]
MNLHATPWGRHVTEGAVEWLPSAWRILRAPVATWYGSHFGLGLFVPAALSENERSGMTDAVRAHP